MPEFKDNNGKPWSIVLDAPTIFGVRRDTCDREGCKHKAGDCAGVDLAGPDGVAYESLAADPCLLVNVLWLLCKKQAAEAGVDEPQFASGLTGDAIDQATAAMLAGIADFFPPAKRALILAVIAKNNKMREMGMAKALAKIDDPDLEARAIAAVEAEMDVAIESALTRLSSATNTPAS
jgi:hypothetical protein